jgi:hypothetical protein
MRRRSSKIAEATAEAPATRSGRRHRGRFAKLIFLGGIVAFVTRPEVRGKALDIVFGPEEQFEYESVTEPAVHDIQSEDAETAWPGASTTTQNDDDDDEAPAWRFSTTPFTAEEPRSQPLREDAEPRAHDEPAPPPSSASPHGEAEAAAPDDDLPPPRFSPYDPEASATAPQPQTAAPDAEPPDALRFSPPDSASAPPEPEAASRDDDDPPPLRFSLRDSSADAATTEPQSDTGEPPIAKWPPADTAAEPEPPSSPWTSSSAQPSVEPSPPDSDPPAAAWPEASAEPGEAGSTPQHPPADAAREVPEHAWGVPTSESPGVTHTPVPPADEPPPKPAYQRLLAEPPAGEPTTRPAIGEATPPRSGWWLPRRRREDSEPTQWDWRSE